MKKVNLNNLKVIDVHCHPYHPITYHMEEDDFVRNLSLSVLPEMFVKQLNENLKPYPRTNMFVQIMIMKLANFFSCNPTLKDVLKSRNESSKNHQNYEKMLFDDANLSALLLDFSYPTPRVKREEFLNTTTIQKFEIYRIEPVMDRLREENEEFYNFIEAYREELRSSLKSKNILGLKSIIAYRSGLEVGMMDENAARNDYQEFQKNHRAVVKSLRDYCFHIAMEECNYADKVMHIHTGVGDGEVVLAKASPKFLLDVLRNPKYIDTKVHLVHGGYPWIEEAAFIVSILPKVYMDISLQIPFAGHGAERIISKVFEFAPFDKVMYGSDAINLPEIYWVGVKIFKEAFERVLNSWINMGYMTHQMAESIGKMVLYQNFIDVYQDAVGENLLYD
ncbi:amidohydrolase family protein [Metabacillus litoralis]|uniref:amidohydrolase family protein n=1 Tax=Metabacillus litoralis TaxID=152268 RepID=UPI0020403F16|nr:amidohydrolase family protein [Metabacillus litoralis]MCM3409515.1 amidohydrolase family protein [Metabacillus litoralis]